jgi:hypothetical protein
MAVELHRKDELALDMMADARCIVALLPSWGFFTQVFPVLWCDPKGNFEVSSVFPDWRKQE